ncbi:unnamed protein product [Echinostoma caproni]|uniref:PH domain-containing protein n=1 Tax=Echinostoma caproni TaxID=27848 RepID=A0A183ABN1_9TREM|nr:unnamed protein product [Echinostoma caproni]
MRLIVCAASDCLRYMRKGSELIKLRTSGRQYKRTFYLDDHMRCIRWVSSSKRHARAQRHASSMYGSSACLNLTASTFTINHGPEFETLELLANSPEEANIWVTGLKCLMTGAQDPHILEERQKSRDRWLQRVFTEADHGNTGYLSEFDALRLIRSLNPHLSATHLRQQLKVSLWTAVRKDSFCKKTYKKELKFVLARMKLV